MYLSKRDFKGKLEYVCVVGGGNKSGRDLNVTLEENIGIFHKSPFPSLLSFCAPIKTAYTEDTFNILLISNTFLGQPLLQRK